MTAQRMTGGGQGRRVRYVAEIVSDDVYPCHCEMCRRGAGGASIAFVGVAADALTWESGPDRHVSSPIARRPFCAAGGTPLGFAFLDGGGNVDITLGSFDDPARFRPTRNHAGENILPVWQDVSHLPGTRSQDNAVVAQRWKDAIGKLPD